MAILPLFPLNTVLFPGMQLKLHIFEERFKLMINRCIEDSEPFGIVLIKDGREALGPMPNPFVVGCAAVISDVERLPRQRMNIIATGQRRFRIKDIDRSRPYLLAEVEYFTPAEDRPKLIRQYAELLRPLVIRYLEILSLPEGAQIDSEQIPRRPRAIAQIASILLQAENNEKQEILAIASLSKLLEKLVEIYRLESLLMEVRQSPPREDFDIGPFSSN